MANFLELQDKIGYEFKQEKLLRQALTALLRTRNI